MVVNEKTFNEVTDNNNTVTRITARWKKITPWNRSVED